MGVPSVTVTAKMACHSKLHYYPRWVEGLDSSPGRQNLESVAKMPGPRGAYFPLAATSFWKAGRTAKGVLTLATLSPSWRIFSGCKCPSSTPALAR